MISTSSMLSTPLQVKTFQITSKGDYILRIQEDWKKLPCKIWLLEDAEMQMDKYAAFFTC